MGTPLNPKEAPFYKGQGRASKRKESLIKNKDRYTNKGIDMYRDKTRTPER